MIILCPHCKTQIIIEQMNCGVFIHGVYRKTGKQVPPHLSKTKCKTLITRNLIHGCGTKFRIVNNELIKLI